MLIIRKISVLFFIITTITLSFGGYYIDLPDLTIYQKIALLIFSLICVMLFGIDKRKVWPYIFFSTSIFISYFMANILGQNPSLSLMLTSFVSMSTGFVFLMVKINRSIADKILPSLIALPIISILIGLLLFLVSGKPPWLIEFTGAMRLSGALHPAHLAMLCVISLMASCIYPFKNEYSRLSIILLISVILLLTGSRGGLIAAIIAMLPLSRMFLRINFFIGFLFLLVPLWMVLAVPIENILIRSFGSEDEIFNTSGRSTAWAYFIEMNSGTELFGKGFGQVTLLTTGLIAGNLGAFVVPHNEYVRFYYDIGFVGASILFIGFFGFLISRSLLYKSNKFLGLCFTLSFAVYSIFDNTFGTPQLIVGFLIIFSALDIYSRQQPLVIKGKSTAKFPLIV